MNARDTIMIGLGALAGSIITAYTDTVQGRLLAGFIAGALIAFTVIGFQYARRRPSA